MVPALIIVRVGLNLTHGSETALEPKFSFHKPHLRATRAGEYKNNNKIPFEVGVVSDANAEKSNHSYTLSEISSSTKIGYGPINWDEESQRVNAESGSVIQSLDIDSCMVY